MVTDAQLREWERLHEQHENEWLCRRLEEWPCAVSLLVPEVRSLAARLAEAEEMFERERRETQRLRDALGWDPEDPEDNYDLVSGDAAALAPGAGGEAK